MAVRGIWTVFFSDREQCTNYEKDTVTESILYFESLLQVFWLADMDNLRKAVSCASRNIEVIFAWLVFVFYKIKPFLIWLFRQLRVMATAYFLTRPTFDNQCPTFELYIGKVVTIRYTTFSCYLNHKTVDELANKLLTFIIYWCHYSL